MQNKKDRRIVYQSRGFKEKLRSARGYKRTARTLPQTSGEIFFSKIGLGSWWSRVITTAVLFLLIYLVFIPNPFFIKQVTVNGADAATNNEVLKITKSFLTKNTPWPQQNLLVLSDSTLKNYLLNNDGKILAVDIVKKSLPNHLTISFTPRVNNFAIQTPNATDYTISSDGIVTQEVIENASSTLPGGLILIKLDDPNTSLIPGQRPLADNYLNFLRQLQAQLSGITNTQITTYELETLNDNDIIVKTKAGYTLKFDMSSDVGQQINSLRALFAQFTPSDIKNLYYIDMRFQDKAYVCNLGNPCVNPVILPTNTSTPSSTPTN